MTPQAAREESVSEIYERLRWAAARGQPVAAVYVVQLANVRVVQGRDGACFALEAVRELFLRGFDGNNAVHSVIAGLPHFTHASRADARDYFVRSQTSPRVPKFQ